MNVPVWIKQLLRQDLVYWGNPQPDGEGGFTFDNPVQIKGRCEFRVEQVITPEGEEKVSRARVYVDRQLTEGGYLYLGTLDDEAVGDAQTPMDTKGSMKIITFESTPDLDTSGIVYKVYLNM